MINSSERNRLIAKIVFVVLISLALLSIIRVFLLHQNSLVDELVYILVIEEMLFSIASALFVIAIVYMTMFKDVSFINKKAITYAFTDGLTGLYNRRYLNDFLEKFSSLRKNDAEFAIMFIDIDNFKYVNDKEGHMTGDCVLKCMSISLKSLIRPEDILCRYGGEEFVIILSDISKDDALLKAEQIRDTIEHQAFRCKHKHITISIGISFGLQDDDINRVMEESDKALYIAKNAGKNCTRTFTSEYEN